MATLWIDNNLVIRWHPNGWPVMPGNPDVIWMDQGSIDQFNKALAQAKAEAIPFATDEDRLSLQRIILRDYLIDWTPQSIVSEEWKLRMKPDTFIDLDGEVEVVRQWKWLDGWRNCDETEYNDRVKNGNKVRTVARLKPDKQRCEYELAVEKYFGLVNWPVDEPIKEGSDYTNLVNLLAMFDQEQNEQLRAQLAAAEKRCKELEEFYWIAEYALRDIDAFHWVIDPIKRARVALEKISKLPIPVKYEEQTK